jgi:hypothetical protein
MAHLWTIAAGSVWAPVPLDGAAFALGPDGPTRLSAPRVRAAGPDTIVLRRTGAGPDTCWSLLIPAAVAARVNGVSSPLGIVVLVDRDEIRLPGADPVFLSTETLPTVVPFATGTSHGFCPRCRQPLEPGAPSVECPACGLWYHQTDTLPCWTYSDRCVACGRPTPLDAGYAWSPEEV